MLLTDSTKTEWGNEKRLVLYNSTPVLFQFESDKSEFHFNGQESWEESLPKRNVIIFVISFQNSFVILSISKYNLCTSTGEIIFSLQFVCVCLCVSVCLSVNKIPAERMDRF